MRGNEKGLVAAEQSPRAAQDRGLFAFHVDLEDGGSSEVELDGHVFDGANGNFFGSVPDTEGHRAPRSSEAGDAVSVARRYRNDAHIADAVPLQMSLQETEVRGGRLDGDHQARRPHEASGRKANEPFVRPHVPEGVTLLHDARECLDPVARETAGAVSSAERREAPLESAVRSRAYPHADVPEHALAQDTHAIGKLHSANILEPPACSAQLS